MDRCVAVLKPSPTAIQSHESTSIGMLVESSNFAVPGLRAWWVMDRVAIPSSLCAHPALPRTWFQRQ